MTHFMNYDLLPENLRPGMKRYIEGGVKPGSFLQAVICNDFARAVTSADEDSLAATRNIALFLINEAPSLCHGSALRMHDWIERGGLNGRQA